MEMAAPLKSPLILRMICRSRSHLDIGRALCVAAIIEQVSLFDSPVSVCWSYQITGVVLLWQKLYLVRVTRLGITMRMVVSVG